MPGLVKLVGIHGTIVFATPEKAERLMRLQGYQVFEESAPEATTELVKAKRGRPKKV